MFIRHILSINTLLFIFFLSCALNVDGVIDRYSFERSAEGIETIELNIIDSWKTDLQLDPPELNAVEENNIRTDIAIERVSNKNDNDGTLENTFYYSIDRNNVAHLEKSLYKNNIWPLYYMNSLQLTLYCPKRMGFIVGMMSGNFTLNGFEGYHIIYAHEDTPHYDSIMIESAIGCELFVPQAYFVSVKILEYRENFKRIAIRGFPKYKVNKFPELKDRLPKEVLVYLPINFSPNLDLNLNRSDGSIIVSGEAIPEQHYTNLKNDNFKDHNILITAQKRIEIIFY